MVDPSVITLNYLLITAENTSFGNPVMIEEEYLDFKIKLDEGNLVVEMKEHFSSEVQARKRVEPFLKAWELDNFLNLGTKEISFEFLGSKIIDRNPIHSKAPKILYAEVAEFVTANDSITCHLIRKNYPKPPKGLSYSPDVESLSKRYEGFLAGREPLISMAYFCLSLLQSSAKGRTKAATKYKIELDILDKLGTLTSERGDRTDARKLDKDSTLIPLTNAEIEWICQTIRLIIRRKAEYDFDPASILLIINNKAYS